MVTQRTYYRCPVCGLSRHPKFLGIGEEGFDSETYPAHVLGAVVFTYGGHRRISAHKRGLTLEDALALRGAMTTALARLDAELEEAAGEPIENLLAQGTG